MKVMMISILIAFGFMSHIKAQKENFTIKTGVGYYLDVLGAVSGEIFWVEGGVNLNSNFSFNTRLSMATISWEMKEGAFSGFKTLALRHMADFTFSRPIKISGQHYFEPGIGLKLKREFHLYPDIQYINNSGSYTATTTYSYIFYDIGFTFYLDYHYQFPSRLYLGLRTDMNAIWALGFEGLTISPLFGFKF
jgi:hypothetical protein